tara:strand:+ start:756 stop:1658 length:903 start_codon:yes stop_codon:yes gene_type:complete
MLFVKQLLSNIGLLDNEKIDYSIACISTSRPIYLAFDQKSNYPIYVVRKIDDEAALKSHSIHTQLYKLVGNLVPQTIGLYPFAGKEYSVQHGVKGVPWFQLKSRIHTEEARTQLEKRTWQTLEDFQAAIKSESNKETKDLHPHQELKKVCKAYQSTGEILSAKLEKLLERAVYDLSRSPTCPSIPQHGDFCLNNLIVDANHITVIDFEDFSITNMPMYDHFTLALSLPSYSDEPDIAAATSKKASIIDAAHTLGIPEDIVRWHFLHHLLLRLGPWSTGEKRLPYRAWLKRILNYFIEDQL